MVWRQLAAGAAAVLMAGLLGGAVTLAVRAWQTDAEIDALRDALAREAAAHPPPPTDATRLQALPEPVRRWVAFTFRTPVRPCTQVDVAMSGRFRRPRTEDFKPTLARQTLAVGTPALVFDAQTQVLTGVGARAFDAYIGGHMTMKARVLSAVTVVDEAPSPALNLSSLRRWLLESAFVPAALLPGGPVSWLAVDSRHARAVVRHAGLQATLLARFDVDGRLASLDAEQDGDLSLPYHGSGERVERSDYRLVGGQMIPHRFVVSRVAGGRALPFWDGEVTAVRPLGPAPCGAP